MCKPKIKFVITVREYLKKYWNDPWIWQELMFQTQIKNNVTRKFDNINIKMSHDHRLCSFWLKIIGDTFCLSSYRLSYILSKLLERILKIIGILVTIPKL